MTLKLRPRPEIITATVLTMDSETRELETHKEVKYEPDRDPTTSVARFCPTADEDQAQSMIWKRDWFNTWVSQHYVASVTTNNEVGQGELPPFSTFVNEQPLYPEMSRRPCDGVVRSETVTSGSSCPAAGPQVRVMERSAYGEQMVSNQVTQRLTVPHTDAAGQLLNPDPVPATSSELAGPNAVISFTISPTEEDLSQMQSFQDMNGYIKRPMNGFMVWSRIHRQALRKACPDTSMTDTSIMLGCEWSKLTDEQKRPYYKVAHKLKEMHKQQFPDYEFRPQKKKARECLSVGQRAGENPSVSSIDLHTIPLVPSMSQAPTTCSGPSVISYMVGHYPYSSFGPYQATSPYPSIQSNISRFPYANSPTVEVRNYKNTHLQRDETALNTKHHPAGVSREVLIGSISTPVCLKQSAVVTVNEVECKYEDDVDVVALEDVQCTQGNFVSNI